MNGRIYGYVGPHDLIALLDQPSSRACIRSAADVRAWVAAADPSRDQGDEVVATFIVDQSGDLWVADRRSEHVACARGADVLSAGEITFTLGRGLATVVEVTNQSTGYCPEPVSWPAVAAALDRAGLAHPDGFTAEFIFRRCASCGSTNVVKDSWFECAVCGSPLPREWNFA